MYIYAKSPHSVLHACTSLVHHLILQACFLQHKLGKLGTWKSVWSLAKNTLYILIPKSQILHSGGTPSIEMYMLTYMYMCTLSCEQLICSSRSWSWVDQLLVPAFETLTFWFTNWNIYNFFPTPSLLVLH